jgi:hypothetical protein
MASQQVRQKVSTALMCDIFFHKLKPVKKLPSDLSHAAELK